MGPTGRKLVFSAITTAVALVLLEGVARLSLRFARGEDSIQGVRFVVDDVWNHEAAFLHQPDPELLWRMVPGLNKAPLRVNAHGFRGPDIAEPKGNDTFRILLLGDSITLGFRLAEEETYAHRLVEFLEPSQSELEGTLQRVEVINGGVIGYSSWQGRRLYGLRARELEADLVVVMFGYNDHHSAVRSDREKVGAPGGTRPLDLLRKTAIYRLGRRLLGSAPRLRSEPVPRVTLEEFTDNLRSIREMAAADGADSLFLTVPLRPGIPLVENFSAISPGDGGTLWIRQLDFALNQFEMEARASVKDHFLLSSELAGFASDDANLAKLEALTMEFPRLPVFHYLLSQCLMARGRQDEAERAMAESRSHDDERRAMEAYNDAVRQMSGTGSEVLDAVELFAEESSRQPQLFFDVVHPNSRGHDLLARALADVVRRKADYRVTQ